MTLLSLILANILAKKARSLGIAFAVALAVMTVVTLVSMSSGLENSASQLINLGKSDFTVAQKGVSEIIYSSIDNAQLQQIRSLPGVKTAVGVLLETEHINAANPVFIEIGIPPDQLANFGVNVVAGRPFAANATNEVMLGWRAAQNFGLGIGSKFTANGTVNTVVGIYSTGISYGDLGAMFPLTAVQAYNRVPGSVTLVFVKAEPGYPVNRLINAINTGQPELTTIQTAAQFGRASRDLVFFQAAATATTIIAVIIGAVIVANTMLLSLFERTREFGLLRAIGWARGRVVALVVGEGVLLALVGSIAGVGLSFAATTALQALPQLTGVLHANFTQGAFWRGLLTGVVMAVVGCLYPAIRAANLTPLKALSHE